jgi:hypothetical protein
MDSTTRAKAKNSSISPNWLCRALSSIFPLCPSFRDLVFRLERSFLDKFDGNAFPWKDVDIDRADFTAGQLHEWMRDQLRRQGRPVPHSSWHRVQAVLVDGTGANPSLVRLEAYVQRDLRYFEGG